MNEEQLKRLQELLAKLREQAKELGREFPFADDPRFQSEATLKGIEDYGKAFQDLSNQVESFADLIDGINNDLGGIAAAITATIQELGASSEGYNNIKTSLRGIGRIARDLKLDQEDIVKLNEKQLESLDRRLQQNIALYEINQSAIEQRKQDLQEEIRQSEEKKQRGGTLSKQEISQLDKRKKELGDILTAERIINDEIQAREGKVDGVIEKEKTLSQILEARIKQRREQEEQISNATKNAKSLADILGRIPLIGPSVRDAFSEVESEIRKTLEEKGDLDDGFNATGLLISKLGKKIKENLKNPIVLAIVAFKQLSKSLSEVDKDAGDLAKQFNLTYLEAQKIRQELVSAAGASNELFVTSKALQETLGTLNAAVGTRTFSGLSNELQQSVVFLTKLREESDVTAEQLQVLAELTFVTGQNTEDITANLLGAVEVFAARQGLIINEKDLFKQIEQFSKATLLTLSQTPYRIGEAVAEARSLGTTLSQVEAISGTIVNFQSSIQDELAAQVLTGRALNLNAARLAALNNDTATVAKEIREQIGGAADFGRLNRIQQEAFARAIGVGRDEMAQMLLVQEQIAGLQGEEAERRQKAVELLIKQRGIDGAITEAGQKQIQRLEKQVSVQEQFTASVNKLKEIFVDIATIIGPLLSGVASVVGEIAKLVSLIPKELLAIGGGALTGFVASGFNPVGALVGAGVATVGVAASQVDDGYFPPVGREGYDRALLTPEGTFKLNNDDNIIAGTDNSIRPRIPRTGYTTQITPITNVSNTTTQPISSQNVTNLTSTQAVDMSELVSTMKKSNELIEQQTKTLAEGQDAIRKQKQNLVVGATNLGTQLNTYSYRVQYG